MANDPTPPAAGTVHVPDQAVEAAARAEQEYYPLNRRWNELSDIERDARRDAARAALSAATAAAPVHMSGDLGVVGVSYIWRDPKTGNEHRLAPTDVTVVYAHDPIAAAEARGRAQAATDIEGLIDPEAQMATVPFGDGVRYFREQDIRDAIARGYAAGQDTRQP